MKSKWKSVKLGDYIFEINRRNRAGENIEVFSVTNTEGFTKSTDYFSKEVFSKETTNYKIVHRGEFAYNPSRINVGSIDYLDDIERVMISPMYIVFGTKKELDNKYLKAFLKSPYGLMQVKKRTTGSVRDTLKYSNLETIEISLPPIDDQARIATVLSGLQALIEKRFESIRLIDELLKNIFIYMFGDPANNPNNFPIKTLKEFYINSNEGTKCGPFGSALKKNEYVKFGVPVWTMDNILSNGRFLNDALLWIDKGKYQKLKGYSVVNNDVIVSRAGTVGKMCIINSNYERSIINTNLIRVRFGNELLPIYFVTLMTYFKERLIRLKKGSDNALTHMNTRVLDELIFPYPPIPLQKQFAQVAAKIERTRSRCEESLEQFEKLYIALSQRAFRGELALAGVPIVDKTIFPAGSGQGFDELSEIDVKTRHFPASELEQLIQSMGPIFYFQDLWDKIQDFCEEAPDYNKVKERLFSMLEEGNPLRFKSRECK